MRPEGSGAIHLPCATHSNSLQLAKDHTASLGILHIVTEFDHQIIVVLSQEF